MDSEYLPMIATNKDWQSSLEVKRLIQNCKWTHKTGHLKEKVWLQIIISDLQGHRVSSYFVIHLLQKFFGLKFLLTFFHFSQLKLDCIKYRCDHSLKILQSYFILKLPFCGSTFLMKTILFVWTRISSQNHICIKLKTI